MCVIMKFPLRFEVVGGNSSPCLVHTDCVSGEESQKTINREFVKNSGTWTRLPAPQRSAFCFANLRILASQMDCQAHSAHVARRPLHLTIWKSFFQSLGRLGGLFISSETRPTQMISRVRCSTLSLSRQAVKVGDLPFLSFPTECSTVFS